MYMKHKTIMFHLPEYASRDKLLPTIISAKTRCFVNAIYNYCIIHFLCINYMDKIYLDVITNNRVPSINTNKSINNFSLHNKKKK